MTRGKTFAPVALVALVACTGTVTDEAVAPPTKGAASPLISYLEDILPLINARVLSPGERTWIEAQVKAGSSHSSIVREALTSWSEHPFMAEAAREIVSTGLSVSGTSDDPNYNLPGNLAVHLVANGKPWSQILTSDYCVGDDLQPTQCDTGSPHSAGVLTTRAFLKATTGRFNLTRASTLMGQFACQSYPMSHDIEPPLERERLIHMFRADSPEDQEDPDATAEFGNGFACYTCHSQFAAHAQMFVQFDQEGRWHADASGQQDPDGELGRSTNDLLASHLSDPIESALPAGQMLGERYEHVGEAAATLARSPRFLGCQAQAMMRYALRQSPDVSFSADLHDQLANALADLRDPTFAEILIETLSHPEVLAAAMDRRNAAEASQ